tara:strand:- start:17 stop:580 length:564 start_codon:yes stop_codon:yes gene_type:complete
MNKKHGLFILLWALLYIGSCNIYKKEFDNPVDFEANDEKGVGAPTLVFYPKTQIKAVADSILIGSFIVFKEDSMEAFSGVHLQVVFPNSFLELDTITPGVFITDTSKSTPLFTYTYDSVNTIDIYTYFLDTLKQDLEGTGHLADLIFIPTGTGSDSVKYNLNKCEMIDHNDNDIELKGYRGAEVIVQ